jgi:hypothetical protein
MRLRTDAVLACLLLAAGFAPPPAVLAQHRQGLQLNEELRFPEGRETVSVPFENHGEHIMIRVSVNGGAPLLMVFDTGMPTPGVLLYEGALVDKLNLTYSPAQIQVGGAGSGGSRSARLATGVTLRVGGLEVGGSVAIVMPSTPQMSGLHDGIIGASLFQNLVVSLDHDRGVMTLSRRGVFTPPKAAAEVPLEVQGRHAYVPLQLVGPDGKATPIKAILDLGATHAISLNRRSNPAIVAPPGARVSRIGRGMSGVITGLVGRVPALELGGHRLASVVATFPDSAFEDPRGLDSMNGNLGGGVLGRFNISLDVGGSRMFLTPNRRYSNPFEWDMSGLQTELTDEGEIRVAAILPDSPAAEAGIAPGETVVAVDGARAEPRTLLRTRERFREVGRELALTLRRDGRERVVKLRLRRLV